MEKDSIAVGSLLEAISSGFEELFLKGLSCWNQQCLCFPGTLLDPSGRSVQQVDVLGRLREGLNRRHGVLMVCSQPCGRKDLHLEKSVVGGSVCE